MAHLLMSVGQGIDEAALVGFGKGSPRQHLQTTAIRFGRLRRGSVRLTSLYDRDCETARRGRVWTPSLIVLTDGIDRAARSQRRKSRASQWPSTYRSMWSVGLSVERKRQTTTEKDDVNLNDLARWTGGAFFTAINTAQRLSVVREILADLRHQYVLGLEPGASPGWHRLEVRVRQRATTQTRSGYWVGTSALD